MKPLLLKRSAPETADTTAELDAARESEMSIEDLLRNYHVDGEVAPATPATPAIPAIDTHSDTDDEADADSGTSDDDDSDASEHSSAPSETLEALVAEPSTEDANNKGTNGGEEERARAAAALAATLQPPEPRCRKLLWYPGTAIVARWCVTRISACGFTLVGNYARARSQRHFG
ncbi:hypothetical protein EVAR_97634_1 [Eumeta japonica]|uniref:Uncharacterized protein n=1 Tax=Eumeta variegata TaxID=151549 RepID=A0A4C2AF40_EUMVA|nr:hypothetical protein EVAR_97634_1 [Eumeta japonica]